MHFTGAAVAHGNSIEANPLADWKRDDPNIHASLCEKTREKHRAYWVELGIIGYGIG